MTDKPEYKLTRQTNYDVAHKMAVEKHRSMDFEGQCERAGVKVVESGAEVEFIGRKYLVNRESFEFTASDDGPEPELWEEIVILHYLIEADGSEPTGDLISYKQVPDGAAWGSYPTLGSSVSSTAAQAYNVMVYPFSSCRFKGIVFLCSEKMLEEDQGADYGAELSAMANCWKESFGGEDPYFFYTIPSKALAPQITRPKGIKGKSMACEIGHWLTATRGDKDDMAVVNRQLLRVVDQVVNEACK